MAILRERPSCLLTLSPVALTLIAPEPLLLLLLKEPSSPVPLQSVRHRSTASFSQAREGPPHEPDRKFGLAHNRVAVAVCVGHPHQRDRIAQHCANDGEEDHGEVESQEQRDSKTRHPLHEGVVELSPPFLHWSPSSPRRLLAVSVLSVRSALAATDGGHEDNASKM